MRAGAGKPPGCCGPSIGARAHARPPQRSSRVALLCGSRLRLGCARSCGMRLASTTSGGQASSLDRASALPPGNRARLRRASCRLLPSRWVGSGIGRPKARCPALMARTMAGPDCGCIPSWIRDSTKARTVKASAGAPAEPARPAPRFEPGERARVRLGRSLGPGHGLELPACRDLSERLAGYEVFSAGFSSDATVISRLRQHEEETNRLIVSHKADIRMIMPIR